MSDKPLLERLGRAAVASCSCDVKHPGIAHHDPECRYRLFNEAMSAVTKLEEVTRQRDNAGKLSEGFEADVTDLSCEVNDLRSRLDRAKALASAIAVCSTQARIDEMQTELYNVLLDLDGEGQCPTADCPYADGPDFSIGNPCRCAVEEQFPYTSMGVCSIHGEWKEQDPPDDNCPKCRDVEGQE